MFCPAFAQHVQKKNLLPSDYKLWSTVMEEKISDYGNWISYQLRYTQSSDTVFVRHSVMKNKIYVFPDCQTGQFARESMFGCIDKEKNLVLLDLKKGTIIKIPNVKVFEFSGDGRFLLTLEKNDASTSNLCIRKYDGTILKKIDKVTAYKTNPALTGFAYASNIDKRVKIGLVAFNKELNFSDIVIDTISKIQDFIWAKDGLAFAFYDKGTKSRVFHYSIDSKKLKVLTDHSVSIDGTANISRSTDLPLRISDDHRKVFFSCIGPSIPVSPKPIVEIWNGNDKYLYPVNVLIEHYNKPFLAVWWPETSRTAIVSSKQVSWVALTGDQNYAVLADPSKYEPQYDTYAPMDYYIMNLTTGEKELLLQNQSGNPGRMFFSPNGNYICYYKNDVWNIYNIHKKRHTNITSGLDTTFQSVIEDPSTRRNFTYTFQGWSTDGQSVLLNDQYDLWQIFLDGRPPIRITKGKEKQIRFRLADIDKQHFAKSNYSLSSSGIYKMSKTNVLEAYHTVNGSTGYFTLDAAKTVQPLIFKDALLTKVLKASKSDTYLFRSENFDRSPSILMKSSKSAKVESIVETNPQQKYFHWGFSELIHFENSKKNVLNGALFYPANYDPSVKYPMIVYIYQKLSKRLHRYENPSFLSSEGINVTHLTANGYFVLLPDIEYESGNPVISATECVESAVKSAINKGLINASKIGLMGHSFGGYETNFIITKSNLFAAAISGAAISDNIRFYLTHNSDFNKPEIRRVENQQFRMGVSFYEDKNSYYRNSPVHNAENIHTPLLIWTGKDDNNVKPEQSTAFHIALSRLKKEHIMLQYPGEAHTLRSINNQKDLNEKILEWFGYYLKGEKPADWIAKGTGVAQ